MVNSLEVAHRPIADSNNDDNRLPMTSGNKNMHKARQQTKQHMQ